MVRTRNYMLLTKIGDNLSASDSACQNGWQLITWTVTGRFRFLNQSERAFFPFQNYENHQNTRQSFHNVPQRVGIAPNHAKRPGPIHVGGTEVKYAIRTQFSCFLFFLNAVLVQCSFSFLQAADLPKLSSYYKIIKVKIFRVKVPEFSLEMWLSSESFTALINSPLWERECIFQTIITCYVVVHTNFKLNFLYNLGGWKKYNFTRSQRVEILWILL